jgi:hypothetical protein
MFGIEYQLVRVRVTEALGSLVINNDIEIPLPEDEIRHTDYWRQTWS